MLEEPDPYIDPNGYRTYWRTHFCISVINLSLQLPALALMLLGAAPVRPFSLFCALSIPVSLWSVARSWPKVMGEPPQWGS